MGAMGMQPLLCYRQYYPTDTPPMQPTGATPHRIALIADPQLVDPHTYPGRPWPLSTLTIKHTDVYLRRAYSRIQRDLDPHTVLFLGDLFDGGREWGTRLSHSPEEQYHRYGRLYWQKEYHRFARIFLSEKGDQPASDISRADGRRIIASLPGNHDLGFGRGIQLPVRGRFQAYFGEGNRIDVIGNHTFVSLDTVSLSAEEQVHATEEIWRPTFDMLNNLEQDRNKAVNRHLQHLFDEPEVLPEPHDPTMLDLADASSAAYNRKPSLPNPLHKDNQPTLPTFLLTHVPLYRPANTNCGPLREHSGAIPISAGYQYQNTLSIGITDQILDTVNRDGTLQQVFSGDDHDYCEVVHDASMSKAGESNVGKPGMTVGKKIREITVKSISWAMGVRRPGFLLVSLWNPIDVHGGPVTETAAAERTIQLHLCLLPDQLAILIRYGFLFGMSLLILLIRAVAVVAIASDVPNDDPSLPSLRLNTTLLSRKAKDEDDFPSYSPASAHEYLAATATAKSSSTAEANGRSAARPRSSSLRTSNGYGVSCPTQSNLTFSSLDDRSNAVREKENSTFPPRRSGRHADTSASFYGSKKRDDQDEESGFAYDYDYDYGYGYRARGTGTGTGRPTMGKYRQGCSGVLLEFWDGLWSVARVVLVGFGVLLLW